MWFVVCPPPQSKTLHYIYDQQPTKNWSMQFHDIHEKEFQFLYISVI